MSQGGTTEARTAAVEEELKVELEKWVKLNISPAHSVHVDTFQIKCQLNILIAVLVESGVIKENEYILQVKEHILETMKEIRSTVEPQIQQHKIAAMRQGIVLPGNGFPE